MKTIYRYPLLLQREQTVKIPKDAETLAIQVQNGIICLWAAVDESAEKEDAMIYIVGTGQAMPDVLIWYLGTVQLDGYVWHIFSPR